MIYYIYENICFFCIFSGSAMFETVLDAGRTIYTKVG